MEFFFELLAPLLQFLAELVLQIVVELLAEAGLHGLRESFERSRPLHMAWAIVCYALFGAFCGWLSLLLFPKLFIVSPAFRIANLALTPLASGGVMAAVGAWRRRRGEALIRLDRFACGFLFALAMAVTRYHLAAA